MSAHLYKCTARLVLIGLTMVASSLSASGDSPSLYDKVMSNRTNVQAKLATFAAEKDYTRLIEAYQMTLDMANALAGAQSDIDWVRSNDEVIRLWFNLLMQCSRAHDEVRVVNEHHPPLPKASIVMPLSSREREDPNTDLKRLYFSGVSATNIQNPRIRKAFEQLLQENAKRRSLSTSEARLNGILYDFPMWVKTYYENLNMHSESRKQIVDILNTVVTEKGLREKVIGAIK